MDRQLRSLPLVRSWSFRGFGRGIVSLALRTAEGQWTYSGAILMSLAANGVGLLVLLSVWSAAYADVQRSERLPADQLTAYLILAFLLNFAVSVMVDARLGSRILSGAVLFDLARPLGCMPVQMGQAIGALLGKLPALSAMAVVAGLLLPHSTLPSEVAQVAFGAISMVLAFFVNFAIEYLAAQLLFLTTHFYGVVAARMAIHGALSGLFAPLMFFPSGLEMVGRWLPFRHVIETPLVILLGVRHVESTQTLLAWQVSWIAFLLAAAHISLRRMLKNFAIHGG